MIDELGQWSKQLVALSSLGSNGVAQMNNDVKGTVGVLFFLS